MKSLTVFRRDESTVLSRRTEAVSAQRDPCSRFGYGVIYLTNLGDTLYGEIPGAV